MKKHLNYYLALLLLHYLIIMMTGCTAMEKPNINADQSALLALKAHVTSETHQFLSRNWSSSAAASSVCDWIRVKCSSRHQRVTALNISNMGLTGTIPPQLGNLSFLVSLDLGNNSFRGNLPEELSHLRRLRFIRLSRNNFTGEVPMWFGRFSELRFLFMAINSFSGFIPSPISNLSKLEILQLPYNFLGGNIPEQIGNLSNLQELNLIGNQLVGQLPSSLYGCSELQLLYLTSNKFSGHIQKEIGKLKKLKELYLGANNLTGVIPREIGNLHNLKFLEFTENNLTGIIPREMGNFQNLKGLYLEENRIMGNISKEVGNLTLLNELWLNNNLLIGNLPPDLGYRLPNLKAIDLAHNSFGGVIPASISNCSKLTSLSISSNQFIGTIPDSLGDLKLLQYLILRDNNLTGDPTSLELSFITSLTKCKKLKLLVLAMNPLNGLLPASVGNLSTSLLKLIAGDCAIKGTIPSQIGNLTNLIALDLWANQLTGGIPTAFKDLKNLQGIDLRQNKLTGSIADFCNLQRLAELFLLENQFSGSIPECFGNMTSLQSFNLRNNYLVSVIPRSFWNLKDLIQLDLSLNSFSGSIPLEIQTLKSATFIDMSVNRFSGDIPSTIGELQSLQYLNLSQNQFQGSIPESFSKMVALETLDLSHNGLSGIIPKSLEILKYLQQFNVSYNQLSGEIPSDGPFRNFTSESFLFSGAMCGDSRFRVPPCPRTSIHRSKSKKMVVVVFAILGITTMVVLELVFLFIRSNKKDEDVQGTNMELVPAQERVSYYELLRATDGYNESNLLGTGSFGSVYKGVLNDGRTIAVKVFNLQLEGALKSFAVECDVLRSLRHRNLVKVIGSCSNQDFKALVLEYMSNGSLEKWLYSDNCSLDILHRFNIMIDVAGALQYLHEEYLTPVIHCDLKPSNILLDEDMVAHVSDFGIAKLLGKDETSAFTKTFATVGYIAPEYGSEGSISIKCDVFSFGIMLMEVFTRRKPNDEIFAGNMNLKSWVNCSLPNSILPIIDANLLKPEEEFLTEKLESISSVMELALHCVHESPAERLSMKVAFETLKKIKLKFLRVMKLDN